jgi:hypothetical protein
MNSNTFVSRELQTEKVAPECSVMWEEIAMRIVGLGVVPTACAAIFSTAMPAAAKDYGYCRRDITSYMLQCGLDTLAQCQGMSSGRDGDCFRNPSLVSAAGAYVYAPGIRKTCAYAPQMTRQGEVVSKGSGAACLGNPLNAMAWLAGELAQRKTPLRAAETSFYLDPLVPWSP